MRLAGRTDVGATQYVLDADKKRVARFNAAAQANVAGGAVFLDGQGSGGLGNQVCKQVIYDIVGNLLAVSDEVVVEPGQEPGWVSFPFSANGGGLVLPQGDFYSGLIAGPDTDVIRVYGDNAHGMGGLTGSDTYSDGPSDPFGTSSSVNSDLSCYLSLFKPYSDLVPDETDIYYSRLPYLPAQAILGAGGASLAAARLVDVGWHDTFIDPEKGSNALVRDGGALTDLLGERIRVTTQEVPEPRTAAVYVHNLADEDAFTWDLSLARHVFAELALLSNETVKMIVEVI